MAETKKGMQLINIESKILTFVKDTTNLYKLEKEEYKKLLKDSIITIYKKVNKNVNKQINLEEKNIIKDKTIANKILVNEQNECFKSLKDHKPNFTENPKTRLINQAKIEIDRLSKSILGKTNSKLRNTTTSNQ